MSENGVTRLLLIILVISSARYGTPLECYVCTSVENSACTSSLSGIERSTCTLDEVTEPTSTSSTSTTTLDSEATSTTAVDLTSATSDVTSTGDSSEYISTTDSQVSSTTTTDNSASSITSSTEYTSTLESEASSSESTSTEDPSSTTTAENTSAATSAGTETTMDASVTSHGTTVQETTSTVAETTTYSSNDDSDAENEPIARMVRYADGPYACYTLTLIKDNETVTDRGCIVQSSSMCDNLNEEKYPGYNFTTCETCDEDGCNSSPNNLSGIPSLFVPLIMLILTR